MRFRFLSLFAAFLWFGAIAGTPAIAQSPTPVLLPGGCGTGNITNSMGYFTVNGVGQLCIVGSLSLTGSTSNATSAVATSSTNVPTVGYLYGFNGTTWDQLQVDASKYLEVDVKAGGGAITGPLGSSSTDAQSVAVTAGGTIGAGGANLGTGMQGWFATLVNSLATLNTTAGSAVATGANIIGKVGIDQTTPGTTNNVTAQWSSNNAFASPHICSKHAFATFSTAADTQLVAVSGTTTIYICDYAFSLNGTTNIYLEKSTSGTCGATLTAIDQVWYGAANSAKGITNPYYSGLTTGSTGQLCVNSSGSSVAGSVSVNYDQY